MQGREEIRGLLRGRGAQSNVVEVDIHCQITSPAFNFSVVFLLSEKEITSRSIPDLPVVYMIGFVSISYFLVFALK